MTTCYLVRHAIAAERGPQYPDDTARPLTRRGRERMRLAVAGFRTLDPGVSLVLTSPLVRARATADLLREGLGGRAAIEIVDELAPGGRPEAVAARLDRLKKRKAIALVGHEPDLGRLAAWLIGAAEPLPFRKGGIARIDLPAPARARTGRLIWLALPRMLRALARRSA